MSIDRKIRCLSLLVLVCCALLSCALAASASAAGSEWGELGRIVPKTALKTSQPTAVVGSDPAASTVFVGDEPGNHKFRIQELDSTGKTLGAVTLAPAKVLANEGLKGEPEAIEGISVDPVNKRFYVLVVYERAEETEVDEEEPDAGILYSFSTEPNGSKELVSATANPEGVLATPTALKAQAEGAGESLLEPAGITLEASSGDVVILGQVEQADETRHLALERVNSSGAVLAPRYVDPIEIGEEEPAGTFNSEEANSPVVTVTGQVYVEQFDKVVQIPSSFAATPPTPIYALSENEPGQEAILELGEQRANAFFGGGMVAVPGTSGGQLYTTTLIKEAGGGAYYVGALLLNYLDTGSVGSATEFGWTGGGSVAHGSECVLTTEGPKPAIAAGPAGHVLIFDAQRGQIVEYGVGGKGCPTAGASAPAASVGAEALPESGGVVQANAGASVRLLSTVRQANAKSVKWSFGEGEATQAGTVHGQSAEATHKFAKSGELLVEATIETDDLATPTIIVTKKVHVTPAAPTAEFSETNPATVGVTATFSASGSSDPNHSAFKEYKWSFGDGQEEAAKEAVTHHTYAATGTYTVKLTVIDALGLEGKREKSIVVQVPESPPPPLPPAKEEQAPRTTTQTTTPTVTSPPPGGGVLGYSASFASKSLTVSAAGVVTLKVDCAGRSSCKGTVTLRTAGAGSVKGKHKSVLTLASGSFSAGGGQVKTLTLHLSAAARKLLAHSHTLKAQATIIAKDAQNASHTTQAVLTLHAAKGKH
jgi:PKD repeat protein